MLQLVSEQVKHKQNIYFYFLITNSSLDKTVTQQQSLNKYNAHKNLSLLFKIENKKYKVCNNYFQNK